MRGRLAALASPPAFALAPALVAGAWPAVAVAQDAPAAAEGGEGEVDFPSVLVVARRVAAEYLSNANHGKGILLGGISGVPPAKVVILGVGAVGT